MVLQKGKCKLGGLFPLTRAVGGVLRTCGRGPSPSLVPGSTILGCSGDALPLCMMVLLKFSLGPALGASTPLWGIDEAGTWAAEILQQWAMGILQHSATLQHAAGSGLQGSFRSNTTVGSGR